MDLSAALQPIESLEDPFMVFLWNPKSVIGDTGDYLRLVTSKGDLDTCAHRRVPYGVVHAVRGHFSEKLAITPGTRGRLNLRNKRLSLVFCEIRKSVSHPSK